MTATLLKLFDIGVPVFQAGLAGLAGPELAAAVSEAGGLGHLGGARLSASELGAVIARTKALTSRPFGVNLISKSAGPDGFDAQIDRVLAERPSVLSLFWGGYEEEVPRARAAGLIVMVQVGDVGEARRAATAGADVIIAQGVEAGGHVRGTEPLASLLPDVIRAVAPIPVLAAGGIVDADTARSAMARGAAGVWCGTVFVASHQSLAHERYKQRLVEARGSETFHGHWRSRGWDPGAAYRALLPIDHDGTPVEELLAGGALPNEDTATVRRLALYAGQGVGRIDRILPAGEIVDEIARGTGQEDLGP